MKKRKARKIGAPLHFGPGWSKKRRLRRRSVIADSIKRDLKTFDGVRYRLVTMYPRERRQDALNKAARMRAEGMRARIAWTQGVWGVYARPSWGYRDKWTRVV